MKGLQGNVCEQSRRRRHAPAACQSLTASRMRPPRDAGLVIACDDGGPLMPSHGLHDASDDFSVLVPRLVAPALLPELEEVKLG